MARIVHWPRRCTLLALLGLLAPLMCAAVGCKPPPAVSHYRVAKVATADLPVAEPSSGPARKTDGMLAAYLPRGEHIWFFKLTGPVAATAELTEPFREFVQKIRFENDEPVFAPPADWKRAGRSGMRFETFLIPSEPKPLELTVTTFPKLAGDEQEFLLSNINRWRGQISLPPLDASALPNESVTLDVDGSPATLVSLVGELKAGGMSAPFAGGRDGQ